MTDGSCFWATSGACEKTNWAACGFSWLVSVPVWLLWGVWGLYGLGRLRQASMLSSGIQFDVAKIHDPLAQGVAVALAQRKTSSLQRPRFQRYMKLGAMWAEWPSLTYTPLTIGLKAAGSSSFLGSLLVALNTPYEIVNLVLAIACAFSILSLRRCHRVSLKHEVLLKKYAYPMTFDVFYIPLVSTFVRLTTCPHGYPHITLPDGSSCECIDRFGVFWSVGFVGFVLLYTSALHYKMYIEPYSATMDFRFQTSFQIIMVMARTLNPIVSMLVSDWDLALHRRDAILMAVGFLACISFLFVYNYKAQPCIGSGRIPNNIRALSFSSSIYTTVCVVGFLFVSAPVSQLYYSLAPLPLIWVAAWYGNDRRARNYHVPDLSIMELLRDYSTRCKTVGTIAALYMDPLKLHAVHYSAIIAQLENICKRSRSKELLCRAYALRTLWFCHIENFRKQKMAIGDDKKKTSMPPKLWFKDVENSDRKAKVKARLYADTPLVNMKQSIKVKRFHHIKGTFTKHFDQDTNTALDVTDTTTSLANLHPRQITTLASLRKGRPSSMLDLRAAVKVAPVPPPLADLRPRRSSIWKPTRTLSKLVAPIISRLTGTTRALTIGNFHVVLIGDKHWISKDESPEDAVFHSIALFNTALEVLAQACANSDIVCMLEVATFLLEWYRSGYLRLTKPVYLHVLSTLSATTNKKRAADATHTIHKLCTEGIMPLQLWLKNASYLNNFVVALAHPSATTVFKCASVLALVLQAAEKETKMSIFLLLTPASITRIHQALAKWHASYGISATMEAICLRLHQMELTQRAKRPARFRKGEKKLSSSLLQWVQDTREAFASRLNRVIVHSADSVKPSARTTTTLSRRKTESQINVATRIRRLSVTVLNYASAAKAALARTPSERHPPDKSCTPDTPVQDSPSQKVLLAADSTPQCPPSTVDEAPHEPLTDSPVILPKEDRRYPKRLAPLRPAAHRQRSESGPVSTSLGPSADALPPPLPPGGTSPNHLRVHNGPPLAAILSPPVTTIEPRTPWPAEPTTQENYPAEEAANTQGEKASLLDTGSQPGPSLDAKRVHVAEQAHAGKVAPQTLATNEKTGPSTDDLSPPSSDAVQRPIVLLESAKPAPPTRAAPEDDSMGGTRASMCTVDLLLDRAVPTEKTNSKEGSAGRLMRLGHCVVVTQPILAEIRRRRQNRRQFIDVLRKAQKAHREARRANSPGIRPAQELMAALAKVTALYRSATECALNDFIKNGLEPDLQAFFTQVIKPHLTPGDHLAQEKRRSVIWLQ
ncbi:hypothetical protein ACHHYP_01450 [Achlya hypogyna]|uniref:Uncharacterized protein n=1 Tax=Achlya hypogyna TaxID=1202772 RepID=A0A1V9Z8K9_ACHHY|nr:hypothetical protein ACHHYP_01450 [Achlya hypogyna]